MNHSRLVCPLLLMLLSAQVLAAAPKAKRSDASIQVARAKNPDTASLLPKANSALQTGDLALARELYEQLLSRSPHLPDALRGLGMIALHEGQPLLARRLLQQALDADPHDPVAHAALASFEDFWQPALEKKLLLLRTERPSAALDFALGNLYARQSRWPEAQQAYFRAYESDSSNPDAAANLAISLDRLQQKALAAKYYAQALLLAEKRLAVFNPAAIRNRLQELQTP